VKASTSTQSSADIARTSSPTDGATERKAASEVCDATVLVPVDVPEAASGVAGAGVEEPDSEVEVSPACVVVAVEFSVPAQMLFCISPTPAH